MEFKLSRMPSDNVYYLPVRPFGGSQVLSLLGSINYDAGSNKSNSPYLYGKLELSNNLGGVDPSELTRTLSLFKTPTLNNVYNSAVNKLTSLNTTDNNWNADSFIRMNNDRSKTWQYQEDTFRDIFSGETGQNGSNNFYVPCFRCYNRGGGAVGVPFGGSSGIWKVSNQEIDNLPFIETIRGYNFGVISRVL